VGEPISFLKPLSLTHSVIFSSTDTAGRALRAVRERNRLTQDELGHRAGYSRNYIGLVEQGKTTPSVRALFNIATDLGVRPSLLVRRRQQGRKTAEQPEGGGQWNAFGIAETARLYLH
jgi:transcriptional regulator with XRE-family HTH domain